jgi:hypothetical protein
MELRAVEVAVVEVAVGVAGLLSHQATFLCAVTAAGGVEGV